MRAGMTAFGGACAVAVIALVAGSACSRLAEDCHEVQECASGGSTGTGGGGGNAACAGDPTADSALVREECGIFVSAAAEPGGDGTRERPYAMLQEGIDEASAQGKRVYACVDGAFGEAVTIGAGIEVIGGFDCGAGWSWSAAGRSTVDGPADAIAVTIGESASGATVKGFAIRAASATVTRGSSIAVAVADVEAELALVDVTAGDGRGGADGETPPDPPTKGADAPAGAEVGAPTNACIVPAAVAGGQGGVTTCEDGESRGGAGGLGGISGTDSGNGQAGTNGEPLPVPNPDGYGLGGDGQIDSNGICKGGEDGRPGDPGGPGAGGTGAMLTLAGITGGDGGAGISGTRGQGGGGGGGAKSGVFCGNPAVDGPGASGGGGGAGGCGGKGGGGGQAGGSSIGIVSLGTKLVLTEVTVAVGTGGKGGDGAIGQNGGDPGAGAVGGSDSGTPPSKDGCTGGNGGAGGAGGPGGGGRGGYSIGIAFATAPTAAPALSSFAPGTPGDGGTEGNGAPPESHGAMGGAGECWDFAANTSCGG